MPTVEYFQIPADDISRAQDFYKKVFGWEMQKWNNSENSEQEYWMFQTKDGEGNPGIGGGLMKRQSPQHTVTNFITVPSIEEYSSKIEQSGGKVTVPKTEILNMGFFAVFLDTENNMFGIYQGKNSI
ncbi:MAG TPA: VOC family protein [Candidatus Nitrosocosmicus sp.]|jgi:predicted enzyme related to lactoylglutathione lyase